MSIQLLCENQSLQYSLSYWNEIREHLCRATNLYILNYFKNLDDEIQPTRETSDSEDETPISDSKELTNISLYNQSINPTILKENIRSFLRDIHFAEMQDNPTISNVDLVIELLKLYTYYLDLLTILGLTGIFALVNKSDTEGYYSVGNSLDIFYTIQHVLPFIEDDYLLLNIQDCMKLFDYSVQHKSVIIITFKENEVLDYIPRKYFGNVNYKALKSTKRNSKSKK